jgi:hypothetical protein
LKTTKTTVCYCISFECLHPSSTILSTNNYILLDILKNISFFFSCIFMIRTSFCSNLIWNMSRTVMFHDQRTFDSSRLVIFILHTIISFDEHKSFILFVSMSCSSNTRYQYCVLILKCKKIITNTYCTDGNKNQVFHRLIWLWEWQWIFYEWHCRHL